jgi:hypothetical protein
MARFIFNIADSKVPGVEPVEADFETAEQARQEAIAVLASLAKEGLPDGNAHDFSAVVIDAAGTPIFEAVLSLRARWLTPQG